jgi:hypothetical protein
MLKYQAAKPLIMSSEKNLELLLAIGASRTGISEKPIHLSRCPRMFTWKLDAFVGVLATPDRACWRRKPAPRVAAPEKKAGPARE